MNSTEKLEKNSLWRLGTEIYNFLESIITDLPEDEKDMIEFKFHHNGLYLTSALAGAAGSRDWRSKLRELNEAHRELFIVKNAYLMAGKLQYISIEPEMMIKIDKLASEIANTIKEIDNPINWLDNQKTKKL